MAVLVLVRHGHSTANQSSVLAGWTAGVALTDRGREQAAALGAALAGQMVARIVTSPLQRCLETVEALRAAAHPEPVVDDRLGECRYGAWTGRPLTDLAKEPLWQTVQRDPMAATFPDGPDYPGESIAAMAERVWACVRQHDEEVEAQHGPHAVWVAVSHGDPIKAVLSQAVGAGPGNLQRVHVDTASVSVVRWAEQRPMVLTSNRRPDGLAALITPPTEVAAGDAVVGGGTD